MGELREKDYESTAAMLRDAGMIGESPDFDLFRGKIPAKAEGDAAK